MKAKLDLAHEWAIELLKSGDHSDDVVSCAWKYADAMYAELEKREKSEQLEKRNKFRELLNSDNTFIEREGQHFDDVKEWQPDWSQAPSNATHWTMRKDAVCLWWKGKPLYDGSCFYDAVGICHTVGYAPSFGYAGDWRYSLRERPNDQLGDC